jgi:FixJ family two-component response regulator
MDITSHSSSGPAPGIRRNAPVPNGTPIVYVVDDDEGVCRALQALIESFGWEARIYSDGEEFLSGLSDDTQTCVLLDVHMPKLNGPDLLRQIRTAGFHGPAIIMTAHSRSPLLRDIRLHDASSCLLKPFGGECLKLAVECALNLPAT